MMHVQKSIKQTSVYKPNCVLFLLARDVQGANIYERTLISHIPDIERARYRCNRYPVDSRSLRHDTTHGVLSKSHVVNKVWNYIVHPQQIQKLSGVINGHRFTSRHRQSSLTLLTPTL